MGEQFIDLFTAGAYALVGRLNQALASSALSWLFYVLAALGLVYALLQSALERRPEIWVRHLICVALASFLTLQAQQIDLASLTYAAPGQIEGIFQVRTGSAPHLTYWIERIGANAAIALRALTHSQPVLTVPGVAAQVDDIAADPATVNDPQVKANLEIWRRRLVPQVLRDRPDLAEQLRSAGLMNEFLNPTPVAAQFVGTETAARAAAVRNLLASSGLDFPAAVAMQAPMINQMTQNADAASWSIVDDAPPVVSFAQRAPGFPSSPRFAVPPAFDDAMQRADALAAQLRDQLPQATTAGPVASYDQYYDLLGRSILFSAGVSLSRDPAARAALGSLCQRSGVATCASAMAPLVEASSKLHVPDADRYNTVSWTTWLQQPLTTTLLTITSLLMGALSTLVVSVLPFALGVAKAMAILISTIGVWVLLWPGRGRVALSWMVGPIAFVSLWTILFNIWADIEPGLAQIAAAVGHAEHGSFSAMRAMSIAIALGYLGLPSLALGIVYGESGRALYHASARLETALMMAWHTRGSIAAFSRRWIVNSPLARRWNQRIYRKIGLGPLRGRQGAAKAATHSEPTSPAAKKPQRNSGRKPPAPPSGEPHG